jgi:hypothetical protein
MLEDKERSSSIMCLHTLESAFVWLLCHLAHKTNHLFFECTCARLGAFFATDAFERVLQKAWRWRALPLIFSLRDCLVHVSTSSRGEPCALLVGNVIVHRIDPKSTNCSNTLGIWPRASIFQRHDSIHLHQFQHCLCALVRNCFAHHCPHPSRSWHVCCDRGPSRRETLKPEPSRLGPSGRRGGRLYHRACPTVC